jgi:putative phage-type endonuclease
MPSKSMGGCHASREKEGEMTPLQKFASRREWLKAREATLGASAVPIILGLLPWRAPLSLWSERKGIIPPQEETRAMRVGRAMERFIIGEYADETGREVRWTPNTLATRTHNGLTLHASPDAIVTEEASDSCAEPREIVVEAKSSSDYAGWADGVPLYVQAQVQAQLWTLDVAVADVAAWVGGRDLKIFRVEADPVAQARILEACSEFEISLDGDEPNWAQVDASDATRSALNALALNRRTQGKVERALELDPITTALAEAKAARKEADEAVRLHENEIRACIARHGADALLSGNQIWKLETRQRAGYTVEACEYIQLTSKKIKGE